MPLFFYLAKNQEGKDESGSFKANDERELAAYLRSKNLTLVSAKSIEQDSALEAPSGFWANLWQRAAGFFGGVSLVEKMVFSRHLAVMIDAGLSLNRSLTVLSRQSKNQKFNRIIKTIESDLRRGQTFSKSLSKYPKVFNSLYVSMIKVGESGGNLSQVLKTLADQMKKDHELVSRIKGAMTYPAVIVVAMIGIGILMMVMIVPKLTSVFEELEAELPMSTRFIIALSDFLVQNLLLSFVILAVLVFLVRLALKNKHTKSALDRVFLRLPVFGGIIQKVNTARLASTLSSLGESGVPIVEALEIAAGTLGNVHFQKSLFKAAEEVRKGGKISDCLAKHNQLYPPMVIQMVKVGEETGGLSGILKELSQFYQEEVDNVTKNLSSIIEPIIMIIVGAAVGFFAISMIQPMYSMMNNV